MPRNRPSIARPPNRPKFVIDWKKVDDMIAAGCHGTEISATLGFKPDTLYQRCEQEKGMNFTAYIQKTRPRGDAAIRIAQFDEAVNKRDRGMLIWLGKQRLSQTDKEQLTHQGTIPIQVINYSDKEIEPWTDSTEGERYDSSED